MEYEEMYYLIVLLGAGYWARHGAINIPPHAQLVLREAAAAAEVVMATLALPPPQATSSPQEVAIFIVGMFALLLWRRILELPESGNPAYAYHDLVAGTKGPVLCLALAWAQVLGGWLGLRFYVLMRGFNFGHPRICGKPVKVNMWIGFCMEFAGTMMLHLVSRSLDAGVWSKVPSRSLKAMVVRLVLNLMPAFIAGPVTGAHFNPIKSISRFSMCPTKVPPTLIVYTLGSCLGAACSMTLIEPATRLAKFAGLARSADDSAAPGPPVVAIPPP